MLLMPLIASQCLDRVYGGNGKRVVSREECHWSRAWQALQAEQRRETQWHPRECKFPSETRTAPLEVTVLLPALLLVLVLAE
jgi:hypothetical protein